MVLQTLGVVVQGAGVVLLLAHWRAKGGLGGAALAAAWALMILGAAPWLLTASPEKAAALGAVPPMLFGAALLAPDALPRLNSGKVRRERVRSEALEAETSLPGRASRNLARWFGALVAAPALAAAVTAAWLALAPGGVFDVAVAAIFLLMAVWTGALLWLLAASHPWRASLIASAAAALFAAIAAAGAH